MSGGAEVAIELDPRTLDESMVETIALLGFTRASLGVQDISPEVQARIGRIQPAEMVAVAADRLRAAGLGGLNIDLMYGLPGQTVAHVEASARFVSWLGADRVAVFGYAHVPWMKKHQTMIREADLADLDGRWAQAEAADALVSTLAASEALVAARQAALASAGVRE